MHLLIMTHDSFSDDNRMCFRLKIRYLIVSKIDKIKTSNEHGILINTLGKWQLKAILINTLSIMP